MDRVTEIMLPGKEINVAAVLDILHGGEFPTVTGFERDFQPSNGLGAYGDLRW